MRRLLYLIGVLVYFGLPALMRVKTVRIVCVLSDTVSDRKTTGQT